MAVSGGSGSRGATRSTARARGPSDSVELFRSFVLRARLVASVGAASYDVVRASLEQLAGARDLRLVEAGAPAQSCVVQVVVHRGGRAVDVADRRAVARWAATRREFVDYTVGPLVTAGAAG